MNTRQGQEEKDRKTIPQIVYERVEIVLCELLLIYFVSVSAPPFFLCVCSMALFPSCQYDSTRPPIPLPLRPPWRERERERERREGGTLQTPATWQSFTTHRVLAVISNQRERRERDRKSTRLLSSPRTIAYPLFFFKKKKIPPTTTHL